MKVKWENVQKRRAGESEKMQIRRMEELESRIGERESRRSGELKMKDNIFNNTFKIFTVSSVLHISDSSTHYFYPSPILKNIVHIHY